MNFNSFNFLCFAAVFLPIYYLIPRKKQWISLLCASWLFYLAAGVRYLFFILLTTLTCWAAARLMGRRLQEQDAYLKAHKGELSLAERGQYKAGIKKRNRRWLIACLTVNFAVLALCKVSLAEPVRSLMVGTQLSLLTLGLPLGISFYMFQATGYLFDVYRGKAEPEENLFRFSLFISFFPQLIQGPISKFNQLAPHLAEPHSFDSRQVSFGLQRVLLGYFKKLVIADRMAPAVLALRDPQYGGTGFLLLTLFYAVQIYGDFTGGIDVAIGLGQMMGIPMAENFRHPFFSKNIAEYWRRWHITLGEWMKDYIFYPLSVSKPLMKLSRFGRKHLGSFGKRLPVYVASVATWFVTGIWHGVTPNFVLWGMMNCFVIIVSQELTPLYAKFHGRYHLNERRWYDGFQILRMFLLMNFIRACDLFPHVGDYFRGFGSILWNPNLSILWDGTLMTLGLTGLDWGIVMGGMALLFTISVLEVKHGSVRAMLDDIHPLLRYLILFPLLLVVLLMGRYGVGYNASSFIYNQF